MRGRLTVRIILKCMIKESGMCFCEHGNESLESTEGVEFLDCLSGFYLLKDRAPWIYLFMYLVR
jgi:hypothetical protein